MIVLPCVSADWSLWRANLKDCKDYLFLDGGFSCRLGHRFRQVDLMWLTRRCRQATINLCPVDQPCHVVKRRSADILRCEPEGLYGRSDRHRSDLRHYSWRPRLASFD